jgi:hypothetical protein
MMQYLGASDDRELTGQGFGSKYAGTLCLAKGLEFVRASEDAERGRYILEFGQDAVAIRDSLEPSVALSVRFESGESEILPTTMLVRMATSAWGEHPLGNDYSILREVVLDAADEDAEFEVDMAEQIDFAPKGWTYTYVTATSQLKQLVELFGYYFKRGKAITWLSDRVGITPCSSVDETRIFVTTRDSDVAYVAYTTGDGGKEPVFDYVIAETDRKKLVSLPKRLIEKMGEVHRLIANAIQTTANVDSLAVFFSGASASGWEMYAVPFYKSGWANQAAIRKAVRKVTDLPIHHDVVDVAVLEANATGVSFRTFPQPLYEAAASAGITTLFDSLTKITDPTKETLRSLAEHERLMINKALALLEERFGEGFGERSGATQHLFMRLQGGRANARHAGDYGGHDVIAVNFGKLSLDQSEGGQVMWVARRIVHELGHHLAHDEDDSDWHSISYISGLIHAVLA